MFLKLVIFSLFLSVIGCGDEGFNRSQFNKLEKEFVEKELFAEPSAKETTNDVLFLCRSEIKNNQANFYVLKTWSFPTNDVWLRQKEILQELEALTSGDENTLSSVEDAYSKMNGVSVHFDQVVIGAKGGSSWSYLKSGGNAYIKYLDENYKLSIENTESILNGEMQSGFFNINRGSSSDNLIFRFEKESLEFYSVKDGVSEKLDCYIDAPIEPADVPDPSLSPWAVGVYIETKNNGEIFFTEEIEKRYIVKVRSYLPDLVFNAELVDAPDGMELRLLSSSETNASSEKLYELVWKPSSKVIPESDIPSIIRFFKIRVFSLDNSKTEEFRYILYNDRF